jgi:pSer/pThr/pTyr-binding forkhead associated (FHA) protein
MAATIKLTVKEGKLKGKEYVLPDRSVYSLGRANDCDLQFPPNEPAFQTISRHHCVINVNLPNVRVLDFGSRNGTFVNGLRIIPHQEGLPDNAYLAFSEQELHEGDEIGLGSTGLGSTVLSVNISP